MALTDKQTRFVEEYCLDFNATQAAIRAGYSQDSAAAIGWENLRKPEIARAVGERAQQTAEELGITRGYLLSKLRDSVEDNWPTYIQGVDSKGGDIALALGNPSAVNKALELLLKHMGLLTEKVEHTGGIDIRVEGVPVNDLK